MKKRTRDQRDIKDQKDAFFNHSFEVIAKYGVNNQIFKEFTNALMFLVLGRGCGQGM